MKPKHRTSVEMLKDWMQDSQHTLYRMEKQLQNRFTELPPEYFNLRSAMAACQNSIKLLQVEVKALFEADAFSRLRLSMAPLAESEVRQLVALNSQLMDVTQHIRSVADDVRPRLQTKLADPDDPMVDFEIDARIDYVLREDDPDYAEEDDNYLSSRTESVKELPVLDWECPAGSDVPQGLKAEPHCWLFHDLYSVGYGRASPRLSFKDCLRIGTKLVDVQVSQQYRFDMVTGLPGDTP